MNLTLQNLQAYHARTGTHCQSGLTARNKGGRAASNSGYFYVRQQRNPVWAAVWGSFGCAGSFVRSVNLHRCPPTFDSARGWFNQPQRSLAMCTPAPAQGIPLHQHGAFDDLAVSLDRISKMAGALKGIGSLMMPEHSAANEQLNMAFRTDAAAIFEFFADVLGESREIAAEAADRLHYAARQLTQPN